MNELLSRLPRYKQNAGQVASLKKEWQTARLIRAFWEAASPSEREESRFLRLLTTLGWINASGGEYSNTTVQWRNEQICEYLRSKDTSPEVLVLALNKRWPKQISGRWKKLLSLSSHSGITHSEESDDAGELSLPPSHE